jgi:mono/diheme cytochrome c family protein
MTDGLQRAVASRSLPRWAGWGMVLVAILLGCLTLVLIASMGNGPTSGDAAALSNAGSTLPSPALVDGVDNHAQVLFGRYCDSCHPGARAGIGANLRTAQSHRQYSTEDSIIRLVRAGGFDMPAFPSQMLADDDLTQIASYVRTLPVESP